MFLTSKQMMNVSLLVCFGRWFRRFTSSLTILGMCFNISLRRMSTNLLSLCVSQLVALAGSVGYSTVMQGEVDVLQPSVITLLLRILGSS